MVTNIFHRYAGLLHDFSGHGLLNGFPLVHEPGQRRIRIRARHAAQGLAQQAPVFIGYNRDYHRVSARIVLGIALGALAHLSAALNEGIVAADRAKSIAVVPVYLGAGLGNYPGVRPAEELGRCPGVLESPVPGLL